MSKDIAHRLVAWPVADRRALLAYVDDLHRMRDVFRVEYDRLLAEYDAEARLGSQASRYRERT